MRPGAAADRNETRRIPEQRRERVQRPLDDENAAIEFRRRSFGNVDVTRASRADSFDDRCGRTAFTIRVRGRKEKWLPPIATR